MNTPVISDHIKPTTLNIFHNLQEANDKLDAIIENSFDGIYITDGDANTIKVNKAFGASPPKIVTNKSSLVRICNIRTSSSSTK